MRDSESEKPRFPKFVVGEKSITREQQRKEIIGVNYSLLTKILVNPRIDGKNAGIILKETSQTINPILPNSKFGKRVLILCYNNNTGEIQRPDLNNPDDYSVFRTTLLFTLPDIAKKRNLLIVSKQRPAKTCYLIRTELDQVRSQGIVVQEKTKIRPERLSGEDELGLNPTDTTLTYPDETFIQSLLEFNSHHRSEVSVGDDFISGVNRKLELNRANSPSPLRQVIKAIFNGLLK